MEEVCTCISCKSENAIRKLKEIIYPLGDTEGDISEHLKAERLAERILKDYVSKDMEVDCPMCKGNKLLTDRLCKGTGKVTIGALIK